MKDRVSIRVVTSGDMSADITSKEINIEGLDCIGLQCVWTGTPTGAWAVEVSNDGATWSSLTVADLAAHNPAGAAGDCFVDLNQLPARRVRLKYVFAAGVGVLDVHAFARAL